MNFISILLLSVALSADAAAVSVCLGAAQTDLTFKRAALSSGVFAVMQGLMPAIGFLLGSLLLPDAEKWLELATCLLLSLIGVKAIIDGVRKLRNKAESGGAETFRFGHILLAGFATAVDALAAGPALLSFPFAVYVSAPVIAAVTFSLCLPAVLLGKKFGAAFGNKTGAANIAGGIILIALGVSFLFR